MKKDREVKGNRRRWETKIIVELFFYNFVFVYILRLSLSLNLKILDIDIIFSANSPNPHNQNMTSNFDNKSWEFLSISFWSNDSEYSELNIVFDGMYEKCR